ncbi:MAG: glycoside hydrolase family 2 [Oscillospiraceae bacterium]|nr:glycoside hydrolase family 2 [Oscillospiraceae bacterium]
MADRTDGIHTMDFWAKFEKKLIEGSGIADFTRSRESLDGLWNYGIDQYDSCLRNGWYNEHQTDPDGRPLPLDYSFDEWDTIQVPSCWNLQSDKLFLYEGSLVYTRKFSYNADCESERVFIKFGGVNERAAIFLNQTYLGMHRGGSTPFFVEVTQVLKPENRLLVVANNTRRPSNIPMDNTDWFNYGGIYRSVELLRLPATFIRSFEVGLQPDSGFEQIYANLKIDGADSGTAVLKIPELNLTAEIAVIGGIGRAVIPAKPLLWQLDDPKLYDVEIEFGGDILREKIGFREIRVQGSEILLNGKSLFLKGVSAHEDSVANGKAVTEAEIRQVYSLAKEMNCNFMRLAHYPHSESAARIADEVGLLLWEEIPVYWAIEFSNPDTYKNAENQLTELICRDINRASVIIWSIGNENLDEDPRLAFMSGLAGRARSLDPTRLISAACFADGELLKITDRLAEYLDIIGINEYYGWYDPDFTKLPKILANSNPGKPVVITEFGADCRAGLPATGTRDDMFTEDFQLDVYERQIEMLRGISYIKGTSPWIFFDFRCPRRLHPVQNYYNIKGLLTADLRYKKKAFYAMQSYYGGL